MKKIGMKALREALATTLDADNVATFLGERNIDFDALLTLADEIAAVGSIMGDADVSIPLFMLGVVVGENLEAARQ